MYTAIAHCRFVVYHQIRSVCIQRNVTQMLTTKIDCLGRQALGVRLTFDYCTHVRFISPYICVMRSDFNRKWNTFLSFLVHVIKMVLRYSFFLMLLLLLLLSLFIVLFNLQLCVHMEYAEYDEAPPTNDLLVCLTCLARFCRYHCVCVCCS